MRLSETSANKFSETRLRESNHRSNIVYVQKTKENEAHISLAIGSQGQMKRILRNVGDVRQRETDPISL